MTTRITPTDPTPASTSTSPATPSIEDRIADAVESYLKKKEAEAVKGVSALTAWAKSNFAHFVTWGSLAYAIAKHLI